MPMPLTSRFTEWENESPDPCYGQIRRYMCQFSTLDLPRVVNKTRETKALFVNKFNVTMDPLAVACWAERVLTQDQTRSP